MKRCRALALLLPFLFAVTGLASCGDAKDLVDLAVDSPERKPIDRSKVGINNFFVHPEFGSIESQYHEIRDTLGIPYVRMLAAWTTDVQPSPQSEPKFGFFDDILEAVPPGMDVLVVISHTPDWMGNSTNWSSNNPRYAWVTDWLTPIVTRYADHPSVVGFEIWNEPDLTTLASDSALGLENPDNYFDLLTFASRTVRRLAPGKLVVLGATQSIQQNFPNTLHFNERLQELGAEGLADVWSVHFYGTSFESLVTSNGVADFLNSLSLPIWVTESGERGVNKQLAYVETAWPFLTEKVPGIQRIYYYQYGDTVPVDVNFGLRTNDPSFPISDFYIWLRDNR